MTKMLSTKAYEQWLNEQAEIIVRYRQVQKSDILVEYNNLKALVDSDEFKVKKKQLITTRYADTEEGKTMAALNRLKWNGTVILYNLLKKEAWQEKAEVTQYLQLKERVSSPAFVQANLFWKNPKRWLTTPESKQEQRYNELAKHADIIFYHQHDEAEVAALENYKCVWNEDFDGNMMSEAWQAGYLYPSVAFKANHSHVSEQQAYTKGQNTILANSIMTLLTKKENVTASAWHPTKGMILHPFAYTSDVWHTLQAVAPKTGVLQVKLNTKGKAMHALSLITSRAQQALAVLPKQLAKGEAIYTLVWDEKWVINYINNVEVSRGTNPLSGEALHIVLRSYLPGNQKAGCGQMNIDWIRIYAR